LLAKAVAVSASAPVSTIVEPMTAGFMGSSFYMADSNLSASGEIAKTA